MADPRAELIACAQRLAACGMGKGTAGNLSVRDGNGFLITPTGMDYATLAPDDIPWMPLDGSGSHRGSRLPSSEWRFHHDIYAHRAEAGAIVHAHSPFAVSLACLRYDIPPFHYMIARFGGDTIRCADYATFGTQALSDSALAALQNRSACLLANHGMLVFGDTLRHTLDLAIECEALCEQYWRACQLGSPVLLPPEEVALIVAKFARYGQQTTT